MISQITGLVLDIASNQVVIEVAGIGYDIAAPTSTLAGIKSGAQATLQTRLIVREDSLTLYGFATREEKLIFDQLIGVSGVGPKVALAMLSHYHPDVLRTAIAAGDTNTLSAVAGVGKKTAQRIIVELKGSFEEAIADGKKDSSSNTGTKDASDALLTMGFTSQEIQIALRDIDASLVDAGAILKHALKRLGA